jgi:hypothetical protein
MRYFVVGLSRTAASPSRCGIRIDGATIAEADVPERKPGVAVLPFAVPLAAFSGRAIQLEVVHRGSDDKSFVEWDAVGVTDVLGTRWQTLTPKSAVTEGKATLRVLEDGSVLASGPSAVTDVQTLEFETALERINGLRLEALRDGSLPAGGPGRAADGNFVLQSLEVEAASVADPARRRTLAFSKAEATYAQGGFPPQHVIDANPATGWAVAGAPPTVDLAAILTLAEPVGFAGGTRLKVTLRYHYGSQAVLGRLRLAATADPNPQVGPPAVMLAPGNPAAVPPK